MKIYVVRHGKTVWNEKGIIQGQSQNRLSNTGKAVITEVATKTKNINFDVIFCSPLMRTVQTANIFNAFHNVKVIKDDRLIEISQREYTGKKYANLTEEEKNLRKQYNLSTNEIAYNSVKSFLNDLLNKNSYQSVLIVTHNQIASFIDSILTNKKVDFNEYVNIFANGEIKQYSDLGFVKEK